MAAELWLFISLAILSNTAFPLPFDPVLVWFAEGHSAAEAIVFAGLGSVCAGLAGLVDVALAGRVGRRLWSRTGRAGRAGRWFYLAVFLAALLPIPFTTIRVMLLRIRPHPMMYAVVVSGGRLPRYLVTVRLWQSLAIPAWVGPALVLASAAWILWKLVTTRLLLDPGGTEVLRDDLHHRADHLPVSLVGVADSDRGKPAREIHPADVAVGAGARAP